MTYVNIDVNTQISKIQEAVDNVLVDRVYRACTNCQKECYKSYQYNNILLFDVQSICGHEPFTKMVDVPQQLILDERLYNLKSVIEYVGEGLRNIGHYICHVKRLNSQWEAYNDFESSIKTSPEKIKIHLLMYIKEEIKILIKKT